MTTGKRLHGKVRRQAAIFAALGHPHRLAIAYLLALEPHRLTRLGRRVGIGTALLLHHLRLLEDVGLITKTFDGARAVYSLRTTPLWLIKKLLAETPLGRKDVQQ